MRGLGLAIGIVGTLCLALVSRRVLLKPRSHGFWRFWAWETILVLFLRKMGGWFVDPFSWHQLLSWGLFLLSIAFVIEGLRLLRDVGKRDGTRDTELLGLEKTAELVTSGLYRLVRHPLYASLLFLAWGIFFKAPTAIDACLVLAASVFLVATARIEEGENLAFFGEAYAEYMKRSRMFIPWVL